jgi:hypothetical protein
VTLTSRFNRVAKNLPLNECHAIHQDALSGTLSDLLTAKLKATSDHMWNAVAKPLEELQVRHGTYVGDHAGELSPELDAQVQHSTDTQLTLS